MTKNLNLKLILKTFSKEHNITISNQCLINKKKLKYLEIEIFS